MTPWAIFHEIDQTFLLRHQKQVLAFANSWLGRIFFRLNGHPSDRKFAIILPNAVGWWREDKQFQLEFLPVDYYTDQLRRARGLLKLLPLAFLHTAEARAMYAVPLFAGGVTTYQPSSSYITGYTNMDPGGSNTWASLTGGAGTSGVAGSPDVRYNSQSGVNVWSFIRRAHFFFDTSAIGSASVISSATFEVYFNSPITAPSDTTSLRDLYCVASTVSTNTSLAASDYAQVGSTSFGSIAYGSLSTLAYNTWTLNASGRANINKTGVSRFALRINADLTNTAPAHNGTNNDVLAYRMQGYADANKPKLNVTLSTVAFNLSETLNLTDSVVRAPSRTLSETLNLTDVQTSFKAAVKNLTETITLVEAKVVSLSRTLAETLTLTSTALKTPGRTLSEVLTLTSSVLRTPGKVLAEVLNLTDVQTSFKGTVKVLTETITLTETKIVTFSRTLVENLHLTDTIVKGYTKVLTETLHLTDTILEFFWRFRTRVSSIWTDRSKPSDSWTDRTKPPTTWS